MRNPRTWLGLGTLALSLVACGGATATPGSGGTGGTAPGGGTNATPQSYVVRGQAVDATGKPLSDVKITLDNTIYYNAAITGRTAADGRYDLRVQQGSWRAYAQITRAYHGRNYTMYLHPDNSDSFAGIDGAVRNFTWKLTGAQAEPLTGTYGATVVGFWGDHNSDYSTVVLYFEPNGPLIDGSTTEPFAARLGSDGARVNEIADIPLGRYRIAGFHVVQGQDPVPLLIRKRNTGEYAQTLDGLFDPEHPTCGKLCLQVEVVFP
ncbi:carboxypeptidase-like regulatory domain-containing protein [Deinococcus peraridilitoris]|uniref:Carboxypeptidase regulatory-like domain-containing protein n=1 Tax=Deinococcus peraridilitoris (strain DSM 19664 / LMG 22246 / CIP 109416 / KR-200) TaxID=937777 RepID=L0A1B2_DEIPD|nr:carboxypeptidase-like regulatory domain-containing protein [Deinococcus peraridilitoris]AFZ67606.1 hypothetical protein Deipe_2116 [Deinococcus peraridilitoris DSM 19664]